MLTPTSHLRVLTATFSRELLSYRINRFLYVHAALLLVIGMLALIAPPEAAASGTVWWVLYGVLYVGSLSSVVLGLSSAQAETDEMPLLFTHPISIPAWVCGKAMGAAAVITTSTLLLLLPTMLAQQADGREMFKIWAAATGLGLMWAWTGLAIGLSVQDPVRGLISALAMWFVLLFLVDLLLLLAGGIPWVRANPGAWIAAMMLSPQDAYRVTMLFLFEGGAFSGERMHPLSQWWLRHPGIWLTCCLGIWSTAALLVSVWGAGRRLSV